MFQEFHWYILHSISIKCWKDIVYRSHFIKIRDMESEIAFVKYTALHVYCSVPGLCTCTYTCVTYADKDEASLAALDLIDESNLFFWDGVKVQGVPVCVGEEHEPVSLHVTFPVMDLSLSGSGREGEEQTEVVLAFSKNTTLCEIRVCV